MRKAVIVVVAIAVAVMLGVGGVLVYAQRSALGLPANTPEAFLKAREEGTAEIDPAGKIVVCAGDSITHGAVSADYVKLLESRFGDSGYTFINAGVNSHLAYNLLARVDEIVACEPDYVTILIGTNDVNAHISKANMDRYMRTMGLPREPDADWYRSNLEEIVSRLQEETDARIALLSLPPIGEDPTEPAWGWTGDYSQIVRDVADEKGVAYLPLREQALAYLAEHPSDPKVPLDESRNAVYGNILRRYVLGQDYTRISHANGLSLLVENLHLNEAGAAMVADLIGGFIE